MSIFNEFPYTNMHELNLDWIVAKIRELAAQYVELNTDVRDLDNMFKGLRTYVNNYFKGLDVQDEINAKLDEMYASGELQDIYNQTDYYRSQELGWRVRRIKESYICSINYTETGTSEAMLQDGSPVCWFTEFIDHMLPVPVKQSVVLSQTDSYFGTGVDGYVQKYGTVKHRLMFFDRGTPTTGNPITTNTSIAVFGERADVPVNPPFSPSAHRTEAVNIAKSYYDARLLGRLYGYGQNFVTYRNSNVVNNNNGAAMMECDTLVALCMLGVDYDNSPYADDTPGLTYDFNDLVVNPNNYGWTLPWVYNDILKRKVTYTGGECWYYWRNDLVFSDMDQITSGDIVIFRREGLPYFDGIKHTGIIDIQTIDGVDVPYIYHITGAGATGSNMSWEPLANVIEREGYDADKGEIYFARPNYDA